MAKTVEAQPKKLARPKELWLQINKCPLEHHFPKLGDSSSGTGHYDYYDFDEKYYFDQEIKSHQLMKSNESQGNPQVVGERKGFWLGGGGKHDCRWRYDYEARKSSSWSLSWWEAEKFSHVANACNVVASRTPPQSFLQKRFLLFLSISYSVFSLSIWYNPQVNSFYFLLI